MKKVIRKTFSIKTQDRSLQEVEDYVKKVMDKLKELSKKTKL